MAKQSFNEQTIVVKWGREVGREGREGGGGTKTESVNIYSQQRSTS